MESIITVIFSLVSPGLIIWIPVLIITGAFLKKATSFPNGFIPYALFAEAFLIASCYGIGATNGRPIAERLAEAVIAYGAGQGFMMTVAAVFAYDAVHGAMKFIKARRQKKGGSSPKEDKAVMSEEAEKAVGKKLHMNSFTRNLITFAGSLLVTALVELCWGIDHALDFISHGMIFAIAIMALGDMMYKLTEARWQIVWQYWVGMGIILGADVAFMAASNSETFVGMWVALGFCAALGISAGLWMTKAYKPVIEKKRADYAAAFRSVLVDNGVPSSTATEMAAAIKEE